MTAEDASLRGGRSSMGVAAKSELLLRQSLEDECRARWPGASIVHELVMGAGRVRADVAAIDEAHMAAFEIKGSYDNTLRLLHQVGMFALCVPEVWMVVARNHANDAELISYLLPDVGIMVCEGIGKHEWQAAKGPVGLSVRKEATVCEPVPRMALEMLWREELAAICAQTRVMSATSQATRPKMISALTSSLGSDEICQHICAELRGREAKWRADPATGRIHGWSDR